MLILRSQSPRRKEILSSLGLSFNVEALPTDESSTDQENPVAYLKRVTLSKLGPQALDSEHTFVSSDTIVVFEDNILQKPADQKEAFEMISKLNGNSHTVYSGLGIRIGKDEFFDFDSSQVLFQTWMPDQIRNYIETCRPFDKAGAYGIQDRNAPVKSFSGSYTNILGFPIRKFFLYHSIWSQFL